MVDNIHHLVSETFRFLDFCQLFAGLIIHLAHADKPFIDEPENQFGRASPAHRVTVGVIFDLVKKSFPIQICENWFCGL